MKYIKKFESESDYQTYLADKTYVKPNVSWATDTNAVHYDKKPLPPETRIIATFKNDGDFGASIKIVGYVGGTRPYYVIDPIEAIEHNGVQIDMSRFNGTAMIDANAQETYKYTLKSDTTIALNQFLTCNHMTSVIIPSCITSIGGSAFSGCTSLESITVLSGRPPGLGRNALNNTNNCPIYVPSDSLLLYKIDSAWSSFVSRILPITEQATKH